MEASEAAVTPRLHQQDPWEVPLVPVALEALEVVSVAGFGGAKGAEISEAVAFEATVVLRAAVAVGSAIKEAVDLVVAEVGTEEVDRTVMEHPHLTLLPDRVAVAASVVGMGFLMVWQMVMDLAVGMEAIEDEMTTRTDHPMVVVVAAAAADTEIDLEDLLEATVNRYGPEKIETETAVTEETTTTDDRQRDITKAATTTILANAVTDPHCRALRREKKVS